MQIINKNELDLNSNNTIISQAKAKELDLIIICPREFKNALEPLVNHKKDMGLKTRLFTLDTVYTIEFNRRDEPEKIKMFIKQAI